MHFLVYTVSTVLGFHILPLSIGLVYNATSGPYVTNWTGIASFTTQFYFFNNYVKCVFLRFHKDDFAGLWFDLWRCFLLENMLKMKNWSPHWLIQIVKLSYLKNIIQDQVFFRLWSTALRKFNLVRDYFILRRRINIALHSDDFRSVLLPLPRDLLATPVRSKGGSHT